MKEKVKTFFKGLLLSLSSVAFYLAVSFILSFLVIMLISIYVGIKMPDTDKDSLMAIYDSATSIILLISSVVIFLSLFLFFKLRKKSLKEYAMIKKIPIDLTLTSIFLGTAFNIIVTVITEWIPIPESWQEAHDESVNIPGPILIVMIVVIFGAPILEEIIFRGLLYRTMKAHGPTWFAALLSASLFGLVHGNYLQAIYAGIMGLICIYAFEMTGSLMASIYVHLGFNAAYIILAIIDVAEWPFEAQFILGIVGALITSIYLYSAYVKRDKVIEVEVVDL